MRLEKQNNASPDIEEVRELFDIAWQNKDISSKVFGESLKGKSLEVYGIHNSNIVDVLPTNLPAIEANELRLDNLFLMEDGSLALIDYESEYSAENKSKYLNYIARVSKRIYTEYGEYRPIRMIIIYTADIQRGRTDPILDMGGFVLKLEEAFLSEMDSGEIKRKVMAKIVAGMPLTEEELMKLVIYPLTYKGSRAQRKAVTEAIDMAEKIKDVNVLKRAEIGIFVFSEKIISDEDADRVHRRLRMTRIEKLFEEDFLKKYGEIYEKKFEEVRQEARQEVDVARQEVEEARLEKEEIVIKFLKTGVSVEQVASCTGYTAEEVLSLAKKSEIRITSPV